MKLYMLVGIPGSGKSTWIQNQDWAKDCVVVSTDAWVDREAERVGKTYNEVFKDYMPKAVQLMTNQVQNAREKGLDIIWDQTSTSIGSRGKKLRMLKDYYKIAVVFPIPEEEELQRRLNSRDGKHIPKNVIQSMSEQFIKEPPTLEEGFDEIWNA